MADKFVFSNFAVSSLQYDVDESVQTLFLNVDDVGRFPILSGGAKFPLVLNDDSDDPEIVYVSNLAVSGAATVERGREGTQARAWTTGTACAHTFTAASVIGAAGLVPRGNWVNNVTYNQGDIVTAPDGISYISITTNIGSAPSLVSTDWQTIYQPPGAASTAMNWRGRWAIGTTYAVGQVVEYNGDLWVANASNVGSAPADANTNWTVLAAWGGSAARQMVAVTGSGNNYTVTIPGASAPTGLYDGLSLYLVMGGNNTGAATLNINGLGAKPLRSRPGVDFPLGSLIAGELYQFVYRANVGTGEFQAVELPGFLILGDRMASAETRLSALETTDTLYNAFRAALAGSFVDFPIVAPPDPAVAVFAYGQNISRVTYARLFSKYGTSYGAGDGSTTFGVPKLNGTVSICANGMGGATGTTPLAAAVGTIVGAPDKTIVAGNLPQHQHPIGGSTGAESVGHTHNLQYKTTSVLFQGGPTPLTINGIDSSAGFLTQPTLGESATHTHTLPANTSNNTTTNDPLSIVQSSFVVHRAILV